MINEPVTAIKRSTLRSSQTALTTICKISIFIRSYDRVIITICKQIDAIQRFFRRCYQYIGFICCNKSADLMVIIPAWSDSRIPSRLASAMYHGKWGVPAPGYAFLKCCLQKKAPSDCKHRRCDTTKVNVYKSPCNPFEVSPIQRPPLTRNMPEKCKRRPPISIIILTL